MLGSLSFSLLEGLFLSALASLSLRLVQVVHPEPPQNSCSSLPQLSFLPYLLLLMSTTFWNERSPHVLSVSTHLPFPPQRPHCSLTFACTSQVTSDLLNSRSLNSFIWSQQHSHCWPCLLPEMFSPLDFGRMDFLPTSSSITLNFHKESFSLTHILQVSIAQNFALEFQSSYFACSHI